MPKYLSEVTTDVSTENFYWASRLIGALADHNYGSSIQQIERYQNAVMTEGRRILMEYDRKLLETGDLSRKIRRGKNTTRHSEIFCLEKDTYIFDTPGFTSVDISGLLPENIQLYYPEFREYLGKCRFNSCRHLSEPDCAVREAVKKGMVSRMRYKSYASVCEELKSIRRF